MEWEVSKIKLVNPLDKRRANAEICITSDLLKSDNLAVSFFHDNTQIFHQITDCNGDSDYSDFLIIADFQANEVKTVLAYQHDNFLPATKFPLRTQSDMGIRVGGTSDDKNILSGGHYIPIESARLPKLHFVGDRLFKYEGVGLESDQVAYRYYFDHRGSLDIFGKKTTELVLHNVGLDGTDYHALDDWGMDVLKVGNSYGLGTPAIWHEDKAHRLSEFSNLTMERTSGVNTASFQLNFSKLQSNKELIDVTTRYAINYGAAKVRVDVFSSKTIPSWSTGIVNHGVTEISQHNTNKHWSYLATFGPQSLAGDNLGLAIFYRSKDFVKTENDKKNHHVVLQPHSQQFSYYFMANWQQGIGGVATIAEFKALLEHETLLLNNPIIIK